MPRDINIRGTQTYQPAPKDVARIQSFLNWLPLSKVSSNIVLVNPKDFPAFAHSYNAQTTTALTNPDIDTTYINASVLDKGSPKSIEWVLAHEASHLNSPGSGRMQEMQDGIYDDEANDIIHKWNSPQGKVYQSIQAQAQSAIGKIQPTSAPIQTQLNKSMLLFNSPSTTSKVDPTGSRNIFLRN